jgi:hypothetical protein
MISPKKSAGGSGFLVQAAQHAEDIDDRTNQVLLNAILVLFLKIALSVKS